jgi:hypothetical protein
MENQGNAYQMREIEVFVFVCSVLISVSRAIRSILRKLGAPLSISLFSSSLTLSFSFSLVLAGTHTQGRGGKGMKG